jgi:hypothetical protein
MKPQAARRLRAALGIGALLIALDVAFAQEQQRGQSSYMPVDVELLLREGCQQQA